MKAFHRNCSSYLYEDNNVQPGDNLDEPKLDITYFMQIGKSSPIWLILAQDCGTLNTWRQGKHCSVG